MKKNKVFAFFLIYFFLLASLIGGSIVFEPSKSNKNTTQSDNEVASIFKEELAKQEEKVQIKKEEFDKSGRWKPSKQFVITAIIIASILDIVVVLIWAWHENKKKANQSMDTNGKKKVTESKWFWYIIGLGIIVPKNNRLTVSWINLAVVIILMYFLKSVFINRIF